MATLAQSMRLPQEACDGTWRVGQDEQALGRGPGQAVFGNGSLPRNAQSLNVRMDVFLGGVRNPTLQPGSWGACGTARPERTEPSVR